ncbi:transglutaminase [Paenibacillus sp. HN-1]|uniref:transglutaminase domain-containing protein n=1 Tax=Paenibacillus TaxID=44249 RepID=UPI001CA7DB6C|nr:MULTISPECIES: transglutaminase domain-containing protein [Paenibacillus]MBY9077035.1 transglutaminase [Paenibacillus sp. CGMCC 1.18879]MBY9086592.1 transglutaminase [Paenibacillus sinensis]
MGKMTKAILLGMLAAAAVPQAVYWGMDYAYAATNSAAIRSVSDMTQRLTAAIASRKENISFTYQGRTAGLKSQIQSALDKAITGDPYVNYIVDSYSFSFRGGANSAAVSVTIAYRETLQQTAYVDERVKAINKQIIKPGMTGDEKVKAIHDWVVLHLKYDTTYTRYTAYEGLKSGSTVCQGYALLTYKLLKNAGIPNKIVEGTAWQNGSGISHAWNLVQLGGRWYHLDTTWDDPVPDRSGKVSTNYYLLTDSEMRRDHTWTKAYPAASVKYADVLNGLASSGGSKVAVYRKLQQELHYNVYEDGGAVSTPAELTALARQARSSGKSSLLFRYGGSESRLVGDLQTLYGEGFDNLRYRTSSQDGTRSLKVELYW